MNAHLLMGLFALYVMIVSLLRIMAEREFVRLTAMKRAWGRSRGLAIHFLTNVGVPAVFGIVFLGQGVAGFDLTHPAFAQPQPGSGLLHEARIHLPVEPPLLSLADGLSLVYTGENCLEASLAAVSTAATDLHLRAGLADFLDLRLP